MEIIPATPDDHAEIVAVWEASVRATHDFLSEDDIRFLKPLVPQYLDLVELRCVKDAAGAILGFLGVADGNLEMLFLAPAARGRGLGRRMVAFAIDELGVTRVDVNEQNPAARGFYERCGFTVVGRSELDGQGRPFPLLHMELTVRADD
jgi:putative acetyltransferase